MRTAHERTNAFYNLSLHFSIDELKKLLRLASTLHRLSEKECNEPFTEEDQSKRDRAESAVLEIVRKTSGTVRFSRDPRGYAVKLVGFMGPHGTVLANSWGGAEEGYGI